MIVIDASSLVKYVLKEENWDAVSVYLRGSLVSVDYIALEATNAVWKEYVVKKRITQSVASDAFRDTTKIINAVLTTEYFSNYLIRV